MSSSNPPNGDKQGKNIIITKKTNNNTNPVTRQPMSTPPQQKTPNITITKPTPKVEKPTKEKSKESLFDGIPTKTPPPKQEKPPEKTIGVTITRRTQKKIEFQLPTTKYTIEEANKFRESVQKYLDTVQNKRISDEQFIKMASLLNRFKFTQIRRSKSHPVRTDNEKQEHKITSELNKLTLDNFMNIIDNLTINENNFLDFNYLKMLAKSLVKQASLQPLYSSLYSLSATSISSVLDNTEYAKSRQTFCQTLIQESQKEVEGSIDSQSKFASDSATGSASFFGFLANREFVSIDDCFKIVQKTVENVTASNVEICRQILIPAGEKIEKKFPEEFKKVVAKLEAATKDKKIPGSVRYPLIDLLEARKNDWNTKPLMHVITSTKSSNKTRANNLTQAPAKDIEKDTNVKIEAGYNPYNALLDSDDEFVEEDANDNYDDGAEFDGDDMIRRYIIDNEISPSWNSSHLGDLLFAIALRPNKEISKAMKLLQILNDDNSFASNPDEEQNAFNAICETVKKCNEDEVSDSDNYRHAIDNCGTIFARLVYFGISSVDHFGEVFPVENFRITVVLSFLSEMIKVKKIQLIEESEYWTHYKWRPEGYSNLEITNSIAQLPEASSTVIFSIFPLYDCLWTLQDDVDYTAHPDEGDDSFDLASEIDNFPPDVISDPAFATGALEILFKFNMCFEIVLPFLEPNKIPVLLWVEKYGIRELRDTKEIVKLIRNVAHSGNYDLQPFLNLSGDEKHQEIVQNLKNNK